MRLEEWQKFIESQFLDDEAEAKKAEAELAAKSVEEEKPKLAVVSEEKKPEPSQTVVPELEPEARTEPKQIAMFVAEEEREKPGLSAQATEQIAPQPLARVTPPTPAPSVTSPRRTYELDSSMDAEIPDFASYLNRKTPDIAASLLPSVSAEIAPESPVTASNPETAPSEIPEKAREATVTMHATIIVSEPPMVNASPYQVQPGDGQETPPVPGFPLSGRTLKKLAEKEAQNHKSEGVHEEPILPLPLEVKTESLLSEGESEEEIRTEELPFALQSPAPTLPFVVSESSSTRTKRESRAKGKHAHNVIPQKPGQGLSAAELWASVPKHVQTLLAMERIEEENEIAQNSYKRPFAEKRRELIERLLDPVLSLEDTARLLNVCPTTVRRYTNKGILTYYRKETENSAEQRMQSDKETRQRRFRLSDILAFLESQHTAGEERKTGSLNLNLAPETVESEV